MAGTHSHIRGKPWDSLWRGIINNNRGKVLARNAPEIGADTAISRVPNGYHGACAVIEDSGTDHVIAVLPTESVANSVANYAITPDGGYGSVIVEPSTAPITHRTFDEWAFD